MNLVGIAVELKADMFTGHAVSSPITIRAHEIIMDAPALARAAILPAELWSVIKSVSDSASMQLRERQ